MRYITRCSGRLNFEWEEILRDAWSPHKLGAV